MKKVKFISLFVPLLLGVSGQNVTLASPSLNAASDYASQNSALAEFFSGAYSLESSITSSYSDAEYRMVTETDDSHLNISIYTSTGALVSSNHYRNQNNYTILDTLTISNEVTSTSVVDTEQSPVNFRNYFSGPFATMTTASRIASSFDVTESEGQLVYTANDIGLGYVLNDFLNNFQSFDSFSWDITTKQQYIKDLNVVTDMTGTPLSMSFYLVTADKFGGVYEKIEAEFSHLDSVANLAPMTSSLGEESEEYLALSNALDNLETNLLGGNFTQSIDMGEHGVQTQQTTYNNYYDFDAAGALEDTEHLNYMFSNYELTDADQGRTYTGLKFGTIYLNDEHQTSLDAYYGYAVSPDSEFSGIIGADYYETLTSALPRMDMLSPAFFTYDSNSKVYTFDLANFPYLDYTFGFSVLDVLFGVGDYLSHVQPTYTSDSSYNFGFSSLTIDLNDADKPVFALTYQTQSGDINTTTTYFDAFGTTDLRADENIAECLDVLDRIGV